MEKTENKDKFLRELSTFVAKIELKKDFIKDLEKDEYFKHYYSILTDKKQWDTNRERKLFILFAMIISGERQTVRNLVKYLTDSGQSEVANLLESLNVSEGPIKLSLKIDLVVNHAKAPKKDMSNFYNLLKKPRGKFIIINNVEEQQSPNYQNNKGDEVIPKGLENETKRFEHIFKELYFDVQKLPKLTALEIDEQLKEISRDQRLENDEALVVIVISHGGNEKVLGYNACEAIRKRCFGEINETEAIEQIKTDSINIKQIISIFAEESCAYLKSKPKLFYFICCREKSPDVKEPVVNERQDNCEMVFVKETSCGTSSDTFVCYACSEGFKSFYKKKWGMSYFGQALTHSIAQYACDESLSAIMARTSTRLMDMYSERKNRTHPLGSYAIEVRTQAMGRELFFNPGLKLQ